MTMRSFSGRLGASDKIVIFLRAWTPKRDEMTDLISEEMEHSLPLYTRLKMRAHYLFFCCCENYKKNLSLHSLGSAIPLSTRRDNAHTGTYTARTATGGYSLNGYFLPSLEAPLA